MKPKFTSLNILRTIAMFMVFYAHIPTFPAIRDLHLEDSAAISGAIAVSLFFVISGFVMGYNHPDESTKTNKMYFVTFWNRFAKLFPTALLVTILAIPLAFVGGFQDKVNPFTIIFNLLLLHGWNLQWSISGVVWYLSVILFCYLIFPFITKSIKSLGKWKSFIILSLFYITPIIINFYNADLKLFFKGFPPFRMYEFCFGVFLALFYSESKEQRQNTTTILSIITICLLAIIIYLQHNVSYFNNSSFFFTIYTPISILLVTIFLRSQFLNKIGNWKVFVFCSTISFIFYLFHQITMRYFRCLLYIFDKDRDLSIVLPTILMSLIIVIACSYIYTKYILPIITNKMKKINPFKIKG